MNMGNQLRFHRAGFNTVASFPQFRQTPIYITKGESRRLRRLPDGRSPRQCVPQLPGLRRLRAGDDEAHPRARGGGGRDLGGLLTWAFTFPGTPYFAGYRALSTNGISLPVLGAFNLLGRLKGTRLPLASSGARLLDDVLDHGVRGEADVDGIAAMDGSTVDVLVWNYHDDLVPAAATPVHLVVNVPARFGAEVRVSHARVDDSHGNAYRVWVSQGMPASPSSAQLAALRQAMEPGALLSQARVAVGSGGAVDLDFQLPRFGVSLVTLQAGEGARLEGRAP